MSSDTPHIAVLMGGMSSEHDVSLMSGKGVAAALDRGRYRVTPVTITREGQWIFGEDPPRGIHDAIAHLRAAAVDCAFIALHGPYGEDGRMQGLLDLLGLAYTGSGCAACALAMDKVRCKAVVGSQGIRVAGHLALDRATWAVAPEDVVAAARQDIGFPCVIKPVRQGSSVGIAMPKDEHEFREGIEAVFAVDDYIMVEEFITGTEVTCSVLNADPSGMIEPLAVTEIRPKSATFFDYAAKYTPGATDEITPARIAPEVADRVRDMAAHVHDMVGCDGWSRSDFIIDEHGPIWLEVNTVPGLTPTSLFPQACAHAGIGYAEMCGLLVEAALHGHAKKQGLA